MSSCAFHSERAEYWLGFKEEKDVLVIGKALGGEWQLVPITASTQHPWPASPGLGCCTLTAHTETKGTVSLAVQPRHGPVLITTEPAKLERGDSEKRTELDPSFQAGLAPCHYKQSSG